MPLHMPQDPFRRDWDQTTDEWAHYSRVALGYVCGTIMAAEALFFCSGVCALPRHLPAAAKQSPLAAGAEQRQPSSRRASLPGCHDASHTASRSSEELR